MREHIAKKGGNTGCDGPVLLEGQGLIYFK